MIDMDQARTTVAAREQERIDALVNEEAANAEHRRAMAVTGQQMREGQERARAARIAVHSAAVVEVRNKLDALNILRRDREAIEKRIGFLRADLEAARKSVSKCLPPSPDDYPLPEEIEAWKRQRAELDAAVFRIQAMIANGTREHDDALRAETEAATFFERAKSLEWTARSAL